MISLLSSYIFWLVSAGVGLGFGAAGYVYRKYAAESKIRRAEECVERILKDAEKEIETKRKELDLEAKGELYKLRSSFEQETSAKTKELHALESKIGQKESNLDRKVDLWERREREIAEKENGIRRKTEDLSRRQIELTRTLEEEKSSLQRISGLTPEKAREVFLAKIAEEAKYDAALLAKKIEDESLENAQKKAKEIIATAIQRCAAEYTTESTVSVVSLPNEEMKGRIIGREGRNIRAFETATGINIIVDDTPEAVILSGFDPIRREIAKVALEKLIADGRIHPGRIEEVVEKADKEVQFSIKEAGEQAALEVGVQGLNSEEIKLIGRLKYRTSYGQNVLQHSKEAAYLAGAMAAELGQDIKTAKRAGLLHDIGKSVDHEVEGTHAQIGADLARKCGESDKIVYAIASHHEEKPTNTILSVLIQAADAISASRPGVRRETFEKYVKRLEELESIATSFPGVNKTYAINAGREIRVMVEPDKISDKESVKLLQDISKKIEKNLNYPGQIKITLIRETRVVDYAK
ncbi:ribonuclease Y [bacterium]|nr:ribonuclease Y [bacterium]